LFRDGFKVAPFFFVVKYQIDLTSENIAHVTDPKITFGDLFKMAYGNLLTKWCCQGNLKWSAVQVQRAEINGKLNFVKKGSL